MNKPVKFRRLLPLLILVVSAATIIFSGCTPNKNTAWTRNYQAFITRYNIHFNGDEHYKKTLKDMEEKYEDDYSRTVFPHPIEAKNDPKAPQPQGNFDRSIEKAQKAIQIRSIKKKPKKNGKNTPEQKAWMKREEYNPYMHNEWMMMGRSQYYNGDFLGAASTFFYISRHFNWLPKTVTESKIWQARSYISMNWEFEGENILRRIKEDELVNKTLKGLYYFTYADYYVHQEEWDKAATSLSEAIKYSSGAQKTRMWFLLGQIYARLGKKDLAYKAFGKSGASMSASYRTKFNARIKQSEVYSGTNIEPEVKALKNMTRYDRNKDYLDQIYYAIGNLYLSRGDTLHAIENYEKAAETSTRNGIEKAICQITLGGLYFQRHEYNKAQPCYAEAVPLLPESYPDYRMLKKRSDVLDELAVFAQNVELQDSLLRLSEMSEEEQLKVVNKIIDDLVKQEKEAEEAARREEYLNRTQGQGIQNQGGAATAPSQFTMNTDNSWYFYNSSTVSAGKTAFQQKWGSRKLEDDWRRRNKTTFSYSDFDSPESSGEGEEGEGVEGSEGEEKPELTEEEKAAKEAEEKANDPHNPEFYLKQIPKTDEEKAVANDVIQEGLYNMGVILKDKLEDYPAATSEFDKLLERYPETTYKLDTYYNMYLMLMREGRTAEAEHWRQLILTEFPDTKYGMALQDPQYIEKLKLMDKVQNQIYEEAYDDYVNSNHSAVHKAYDKMQTEFPMSPIMPKLMFLDALTYATEHNSEEFNKVLRDMLERYPNTDIAPIASSWLKGMASGKKLSEGASNFRGMVWEMRLSNDSTTIAPDSIDFKLDTKVPQMLVLLYPTDEVQTNLLLYEVARFNFSSFVVRDFDLEQMNFGRLGMVLVKGFENLNQLRYYRQTMASSTTFKLPDQVRPIEISVENFETLLKSGGSFEDYFEFLEQQQYQEAQQYVLPPDIYGEPETLQEADARKEQLTEEDYQRGLEEEGQMEELFDDGMEGEEELLDDELVPNSEPINVEEAKEDASKEDGFGESVLPNPTEENNSTENETTPQSVITPENSKPSEPSQPSVPTENKPQTEQPKVEQPVITTPTVSEPVETVTPEPIVEEPATKEAETKEPAVTEPVTTQPNEVEPTTTPAQPQGQGTTPATTQPEATPATPAQTQPQQATQQQQGAQPQQSTQPQQGTQTQQGTQPLQGNDAKKQEPTKPVLPNYPLGSEGDDDLLD